MSKFHIKKATKEQSRLRMAIHGPSGSGKTFSALSIGTHMGKVCLADTECGSASKYGDKFDFDACEFSGNYHPDRLVEFLKEVPEQGYDVIIIDSMTHFWNGNGGFLELVDAEVKRAVSRGNKADSFNAWKTVDPVYKRLVHAIHTCKAHVIVTLRAKTEYAKEDVGNGKTKIKKLGMAPEIRENFQYEMDVEGMLSIEHDLAIGKTRCDALDGLVFTKPGKDVADILLSWLTSGAPMKEAPVIEITTGATGTYATTDVGHGEVATELVAKFNACSTRAEVETVTVEAGEKRDQLNGGREIVKAAREAALKRVAKPSQATA